MRYGILATLVAGCAPVLGVSYTDWTSFSEGRLGSARGAINLPDSTVINVSFTGDVADATQVNNAAGLNYYNPVTPFLNDVVEFGPPTRDIISLQGPETPPLNTITFSEPVSDPLILIVSLGGNGAPGVYAFDAPFDILSFGEGYWGTPGTLTGLAGNVLQGDEGHGTIQFKGTFTTISWSATEEYWHGFTIALPSHVPENLGLVPAAGALLTCLAAARLRRKT